MRKLPALLFILLSSLAAAQTKNLFIEDILRDAADRGELVVKDATISLRAVPGTQFQSYGKIEIKSLVFRNCHFKDFVTVDSVRAGRVEFIDSKLDVVIFFDSQLDTVLAEQSVLTQIEFVPLAPAKNSYSTKINKVFVGDNNQTDFIRFANANVKELTIVEAKTLDLNDCRMGRTYLINVEKLDIRKTEFDNTDVRGNMSDIDIQSSLFQYDLNLGGIISGPIRIIETTFERRLSIEKLAVPTENIEIPFSQLEGGKLQVSTTRLEYVRDMGTYVGFPSSINKDTLSAMLSDGSEGTYIQDSTFYESTLLDNLVFNYQRLYNSYKIRGDVESANACYVELKELERSRLRFRHEENPSFKSFFRLQLSSLLKVYTDHGTDPAKAIVASVWVVIVFAIFYFFFPSDWDVTSKTRLLRQYRDFVEKNEHGYVRPFIKLTGGFLLSYVNALTLSLNSFTTLGFGNIPTHGLARYVCVLQGFIGWFLLSIFTVALINQALF